MRRMTLAASVAMFMALGAAPALAAPPNDNISAATEIATIPSAVPLDTTGSTVEAGEPIYPGATGTVWFKFRAPGGGAYNASATDADGSSAAVLDVYRASSCTAGIGELTPIAAHGAETPNAGFGALAGDFIYLRLQVNHTGPGDFIGTLSVSGPAGISECVSPVAANQCSGGLTGTNGADLFNGTPNVDRYNALGDADTVKGSWSDDCLDGGNGPDTIEGGYDDDTLFGGNGHDRRIDGGYGDDMVYGGFGNDALVGGYGDDLLDARDGSGGDTLNCGYGADTYKADPGDSVNANCEVAG